MQIGYSLISPQSKLGEGPLWHPEGQALYWVDIHQNLIERYHPESHTRQTFRFPLAVTALGLRQPGGFITATSQGFAAWDGNSEHLTMLGNPEPGLPNNRFNDGAVGPDGSFWAGTMSEQVDLEGTPPGSFYRFSPENKVEKLEEGLHISNGLGWSPDEKYFYLTDSPRQTIYRYEYDRSSGKIANRQVWVHSPEEPGVPDGLAVDAEGCIWSAQWGGWKVIRYHPDGQPVAEIRLPVEHPTSCTFGGPDLDELFITSAWTPLTTAQRAEQPLAGDVFAIRAGVAGLPIYKFSD